MTIVSSKREKFLIYNTLNSVPVMLIGKPVLIDLRNETSIAGRIVTVDGFMNISLKQCVFIDQLGKQYEFDNYTAPTRTIRYIHIPKAIDMSTELEMYLNNITKKHDFKKDRKKFQKSLKVKKAYQRHKEIVENIVNKQDN